MKFQPFAFAGYEYRDGGRSALLPYSVGLHFRPNQWWIQAEYRGFTSISDDGDSDSNSRLLRTRYSNLVNGGSFRYSLRESVGRRSRR